MWLKTQKMMEGEEEERPTLFPLMGLERVLVTKRVHIVIISMSQKTTYLAFC